MLITPTGPNLSDAADALRAGKLVAFPTDTFFALGANGLDSEAVENVFLVKGRNPQTPVPLLVSSAAMAEDLVKEFAQPMRSLATRFWPGALTIVLPASKVVPDVVTAGTGTVGLRVPDHEVARELIGLADTPITGTSCNVTGRRPTKSSEVVDRYFGHGIEYCIDAPCGESEHPSTVVGFANGSGPRVKLFRAGAISLESIREIIGDLVVS